MSRGDFVIAFTLMTGFTLTFASYLFHLANEEAVEMSADRWTNESRLTTRDGPRTTAAQLSGFERR